MTVHASESEGTVTLTVDGGHRSMKLEDVRDLLEELEEAIKSAEKT